ncbi:phage minor head protein, partial [Enterobacter hormaechei]
DLTNIITDAVARGVNPRETASVISKRLDVSMSKAKTIAQTEQVGALREAQWNETDWAADRLGLNTGLLWLSALKPTTRTWHASRHGKVYTTEEVRDFYAENGNRYNCYCSQIPVLLNDDGSIFNEGLADKLAKERKQWTTKEAA